MKTNLKQKLLNKTALTMSGIALLYLVLCLMVYSGMASRQLLLVILPISCHIVLAVSLNLVVGFLGELSLGHAGFMSVGLFTGCLVSIATVDVLPMAVRIPLSMIIGGVAAAAVGLVVGLPALRLKGDYLAIVTLGCGEIIKNVINNLHIKKGPLAGVLDGALGLNTKTIYSNIKQLLPFLIVLVLLVVWVVLNIQKSRHGRAIMAIRDNRIAAEATGINVTYYKLMVFILAAFFAGMAGVLYGHGFSIIKSAEFGYNFSIELLIIVVFGGMGKVHGSVIAAILLYTLPEIVLREFSDYRMLAYSIVLIVIMLLSENRRFKEWKDSVSLKKLFKKMFKSKTAVAVTETDAKEGGADES